MQCTEMPPEQYNTSHRASSILLLRQETDPTKYEVFVQSLTVILFSEAFSSADKMESVIRNKDNQENDCLKFEPDVPVTATHDRHSADNANSKATLNITSSANRPICLIG